MQSPGEGVGMDASGNPVPPRGSSIVVDADGVYRWVYEFTLYTNPTILFTVLKIILGIVVGGIVVMLLFMVPDLVNGYADTGDVVDSLRFGGNFILFFFVLTCIGYVIYALMQGGKYCVVFTMDEKGITHKQLPRQFEKAKVISALNVLAGAASGNLSQMGAGFITASRDSISSDFANVRSVRGSRMLRVIKVNELAAKNQVYVEPGDYDFVFGYIVAHCPNASVEG